MRVALKDGLFLWLTKDAVLPRVSSHFLTIQVLLEEVYLCLSLEDPNLRRIYMLKCFQITDKDIVVETFAHLIIVTVHE